MILVMGGWWKLGREWFGDPPCDRLWVSKGYAPIKKVKRYLYPFLINTPQPASTALPTIRSMPVAVKVAAGCSGSIGLEFPPVIRSAGRAMYADRCAKQQDSTRLERPAWADCALSGAIVTDQVASDRLPLSRGRDDEDTAWAKVMNLDRFDVA